MTCLVCLCQAFPAQAVVNPPPPPYVSQVCYLDAGAANQAANQAANDLEWSRVRPAGGAVFNVGFFQKLVAGEHLLCRPEPRVGTY